VGVNLAVVGVNLAVVGVNLAVVGVNLAVVGLNLAVVGVNLAVVGLNLAVMGVNLEFSLTTVTFVSLLRGLDLGSVDVRWQSDGSCNWCVQSQSPTIPQQPRHACLPSHPSQSTALNLLYRFLISRSVATRKYP
uniref:Uncharacterized protein n=1 Tax=Electrophorus electricus TaxID=8005 RepID=A0AAY5EU70_ELEEL